MTLANISAHGQALGSSRWLWPLAACAGLVIGAVSVAPYSYAAGPLHILGNSAAIWLLVAFIAGALAGRQGRDAAAGVVTLCALVLGWAVTMQLLFSGVGLSRFAEFWLGAALVGGPVFGWLGGLWRRGSDIGRGVAAAAVGAAFVTEAAMFQAGFEGWRTWQVIGEVAAGLVLGVVLARRRRQLLAYSWAFPGFLAAGMIGWYLTKGLLHAYVTG
jgi:hypothetical protein